MKRFRKKIKGRTVIITEFDNGKVICEINSKENPYFFTGIGFNSMDEAITKISEKSKLW